MATTVRVVAAVQTTNCAKFLEAIKPLVEASRKDRGCLQFALHQVKLVSVVSSSKFPEASSYKMAEDQKHFFSGFKNFKKLCNVNLNEHGLDN